MSLKIRLLFGPLAAILFCSGIGVLGSLVTDYHQVRQTVSEIGEIGSPMRFPFTALLCATAACLLIFALGLKDASSRAGHSPIGAAFVAVMAICAAGVGICAYPHHLHNVFGMAELVGYQAPAVLAFTWRRDTQPTVASFSWGMYALVMVAIAANLSVLSPHGSLWAYERPVYGIVQRSLFAAWFLWSAGVGVILMRQFRRR
jgi:hypothetical membrane protein